MKIIGVTGPTGSGKTVLTEYFASLGIPTINADELYHSLLIPPSPCLDAISSAFGKDMLSEDGSLDRKALSALVFSDSQKLELLNSTVLEIVISEVRKKLSTLDRQGSKAVVIDAPTLIESGFDKECDTVISVISPKAIRTERIASRDNITRDSALKRIEAQKDDSFYISHSHFVLTNDSDTQDFEKKIKELVASLQLNNI